ncbi:MAG: SRPBCC family protein [Halodesulfurarchaeum sp.]
METIEVRTEVRVPPAEAYAFVRDFPGYTRYSKYIREVSAEGDGGPGTIYAIQFGWWKLGYRAETRVTETVPPERVCWEVQSDIDAHGRWQVEPVDGETERSRVSLVVSYDPDSAGPELVDLPALLSIDWVVDRVVDLIEEEGRRVVSRVVADLEGETRPVELTVRWERDGEGATTERVSTSGDLPESDAVDSPVDRDSHSSSFSSEDDGSGSEDTN